MIRPGLPSLDFVFVTLLLIAPWSLHHFDT